MKLYLSRTLSTDFYLRCALVVISAVGLVFLSSCSYILPRPINRYIAYTVQSGDTVNSIARTFGVSASLIADLNGINDNRNLPIGRIIKIPIPKGASVSSGAKGKPSTASQSVFPQPKTTLAALGASQRFVGRLAWPIPKAGISSAFGWRWSRFHEGVDVRGTDGTPFYSAHDGQVVYSGNGLSGYGNLIVVRGDVGPGGSAIMTVYGHNQKNLVRVGQRVQRGQRIGLVGRSGKVTGPHLHFETRIRTSDGRYKAVDPLVFYLVPRTASSTPKSTAKTGAR